MTLPPDEPYPPASPEPAPPAPDQHFPLRWLPVCLALAAALVLPLAVAAGGRDVLSVARHGFLLHAGWFYLGILLWFAACARRARLPLGGLLGRAPDGAAVFEGVGSAWLHLLANGAVLLVLFGALARFHPPLLERFLARSGESFDFGVSPLWLQAAVVVALAPLAEEVLFRGVLLHRFARRLGMTRGIVLSSALFGLLHMNPVAITVFGVLLCVLHLRSRSLWATTLAHAINNSVPLVMLTLSGGGAGGGPPAESEIASMASGLWLGLVLSVVTVVLLASWLRPRWPAPGSRGPWAALSANAPPVPPPAPAS